MGHSNVRSLFVSRELSEGKYLLAASEPMRSSFAAYIKSGVWIDQVLQLVPNGTNVEVSHEERLAKDNNHALMEYKHANGCCGTLEGFELMPEKRKSLTLFKSPRSSGSEKKTPDSPTPRIYSSDCYVDIHESGHFNSSQLIAILFSVVYPLYLGSTEYRRFQDGLPLVEVDPNNSASVGHGSLREIKQYSARARRAQEMLLSCAATFDESDLLETLALPHWTDALTQTFAECTFGITITDSNKEGAPTIYANHAFEAMTGFSSSRAIGRNLDILNGPATEHSMASCVKTALNQSIAVKVALTHRTSGGRKFLNLVSIRPCGGYTIVVHYAPTKAFKMEDLKVHYAFMFREQSVSKIYLCFCERFSLIHLHTLLFMHPLQVVEDLQVLMGVIVKSPPLCKVRRAPSAWIMQPLASLRNTLSKRNLF